MFMRSCSPFRVRVTNSFEIEVGGSAAATTWYIKTFCKRLMFCNNELKLALSIASKASFVGANSVKGPARQYSKLIKFKFLNKSFNKSAKYQLKKDHLQDLLLTLVQPK